MKKFAEVLLAVVMGMFATLAVAGPYIDDYRTVAFKAIEKANENKEKPARAVFFTDQYGQFIGAVYCREAKDKACHGLNEKPGIKLIRAVVKKGSVLTTGDMYYFDYLDGKKLDGEIDLVYDSKGYTSVGFTASPTRPPTDKDKTEVERLVRRLAQAIKEKIAK